MFNILCFCSVKLLADLALKHKWLSSGLKFPMNVCQSLMLLEGAIGISDTTTGNHGNEHGIAKDKQLIG